jgi:hypothetical protein
MKLWQNLVKRTLHMKIYQKILYLLGKKKQKNKLFLLQITNIIKVNLE